MQETLDHPESVNQEDSPLCGPCTIIFTLARRNPTAYVKFCRELFETGSFQARTDRIVAGADLRNSRIGFNMNAATWMLAATLRDDSNVASDFTADSIPSDGITVANDMKYWATSMLGFDNVTVEDSYGWGEVTALRNAVTAKHAHGIGFLRVHGDLVDFQNQSYMPWWNHWIAYERGFSDAGNRIKFECFSWGGWHSVDVDTETFEEEMWGSVYATS